MENKNNVCCACGVAHKYNQGACMLPSPELIRERYDQGLCTHCGEERHSFLFPCEPMLESRRNEIIDESE